MIFFEMQTSRGLHIWKGGRFDHEVFAELPSCTVYYLETSDGAGNVIPLDFSSDPIHIDELATLLLDAELHRWGSHQQRSLDSIPFPPFSDGDN